METELLSITGLHWEIRVRVPNGADSFVVPFPTVHPVNLVYHGEKPFNYGHYGIHVGQEDRLTFLGPSNKRITAYFIDCRTSSSTRGSRLKVQFAPSSSRTLCIPPGVAHAFDGLDSVHTINDYNLFLPDPDKLFSEQSDWNPSSDVVNISMDVSDADLTFVEENKHTASDLFYGLIASQQREAIPQVTTEYPSTMDVDAEDGRKVRLMFRRTEVLDAPGIPEWEPVQEIQGVGWKRHLNLASGPHSGFVPLLDYGPFYVVDHGEDSYSHDAYGIHVCQEDRLTFIGPSEQEINLTLVDCRRGSRTLHDRVDIRFNPCPRRCLIIPNGIAHKFAGLEKVFTINRPRILSDDLESYQPSTDVIDWPGESVDFPVLEASDREAPPLYYHQQAEAQRRQLSSPPQHSTPVVIPMKDSDGNLVRVALRRTVKA